MDKKNVTDRENSTVPVLYQVSSQDEISLVDLASVLVKQRKVFCMVFLLVLMLGFFFIFMMPQQYLYSTVVEIGTYVLPDKNGILGSPKSIESVENAKNKLEKHLITEAVLNYHRQYPKAPLPDIKVQAPRDSNLILLSALGSQGDEHNLAFLAKVAEGLVRDHDRKAQGVLEQLRQNLEVYILQAEETKVKLKSYKQEIELLQSSLSTIDVEDMLLEKQIDRKRTEINSLSLHRSNYLKDRAVPKEALALLLIDNEIRQLREQRDALEQQRLVTLVKNKEAIRKNIEDLNGAVLVQQRALEQVLRVLKRHGIEEPQILSQSQSNAFMHPLNLLMNIVPTQTVVAPYRSIDKVNIGRSVILIIAIVMAIILSAVACFLVEFFVKVKAYSKASVRP